MLYLEEQKISKQIKIKGILVQGGIDCSDMMKHDLEIVRICLKFIFSINSFL